MSDCSSSSWDDTEPVEAQNSKAVNISIIDYDNRTDSSIQFTLTNARHLVGTQNVNDAPPLASKPSYGRVESLKYLPEQVKQHYSRKTMQLNFVVVGRSGVGKSTFIRMLLRSKSNHTTPMAGGGQYPLKTTQLTMKHYFVEEEGINADLCAIDTTGFGDYLDNRNSWVPICNYIDREYMKYMYQEEQPDRSKIVDSRVNACLYFLEPTGRPLSPFDLLAMKKLGERTNLIPIISKSDSMSHKELIKFKYLLKEQLEANNIQIYQNGMPYGVSCSDMLVDIQGVPRFARTYTYGTVNCESPEVSDFVTLRTLLLGEGTLNLADTTHQTFYRSQRFMLMEIRLKIINSTLESSRIPPLDVLKLVKKVSLANLISAYYARDPLFLQQVAQLKSRYDQVGSYQVQQFNEYQRSIAAKQTDSEKELKQLRYDINELKERISSIRLKQR